jgi:hypothetical protein
MSKIEQIEAELKSIDQAKFQKLCDHYFYYRGFDVKSFGSVIGKNKTRKGTPDSYILLPNGNYIFIEYSTKEDALGDKFLKDLDSCFDSKKTKIPVSQIEKICFCYNSKLSPDEVNKIVKKCSLSNCEPEFIDIDKLKYAIYDYPTLGKEYLTINPDSEQILIINDWLKDYSRGNFATPLTNKLFFQEQNIEEALNYLQNNSIVIVTGKAGLGKTRFTINCCNTFIENNSEYQLYCVSNKNHPDFYYDLKTYLRIDKKYLVFVDDANRLQQIGYLLEYLKKDNISLKLIFTVRDYALSSVMELAKDFSPKKLTLTELKDKEIKEIISSEPFKIINGRSLHDKSFESIGISTKDTCVF